MARKDISDKQVCQAYIDAKEANKENFTKWPYHILMEQTGQCMKVCYAAMERAERRGLIDYGVSLRAGWLTKKGLELLQS